MAQITKLEMKGFKSFGHKKVVLPISSGLTAIVGPNGTGKSNIVEALSFVLGQMSAKSLRASRFSDLIYYGSEEDGGKAPAPFAKVSIYFENDDGTFPINSKQVEFSRKVDRRGKSTYRINRKRASRTEVVELLSGVISEPGGYNFVMQGDVDKFATMSTLERREIIDELAGVTEFDEKKSKALKKLEEVKTNLRSQRGALNEIEKQLRELAEERKDALKYKELEEELEDKRASLASLKIEKLEKELERTEGELKKKGRQITEFRKRNEKIKKKKSDYEEKLGETEDFIKEKTKSKHISRLYKAQSHIETLKERFDSDKSIYEKLERKMDELKKDLQKEGKKRRKKDPFLKINKLSKGFKKLHEKFDKLSEKLTSKGKPSPPPDEILPKIKEVLEELSSTVGEFDKLIREILQSKERFVRLSEDPEKAGTKLQQIRSKLVETKALHSDVEKRMEDLRNKIESGESALREAERKADKIKKSIEEAKERKDELQKRIRELISESSETDTEIEKLSEGKEKLEIKKATVKTELEGVKEERKKYRSKVKVSSNSPKKLESRIEKIEEKIEKLKPINERAIKKYEEVEKRYNSQRRDYDKLEEEKEAILDSIDEIDQRKKEVFMKTFEEISSNFSRVFSELSPGGSGELILENPEKPFEGGLAIEAKPAGKELKRAISMSGGEKALVGVAFIFAIQRTRPSSFYVLDEIDAHLDPENQKRVAKIVRRSAKRSQIIVITLKDAMMSETDNLIGVNMDESNESHLVSVDLRELAEVKK